MLEANLANRSTGGQDDNPAISCLPAGMPRVMVAYDPIEIIVTPEVTYVRSDHLPESRRIYTDGRDWPQKITPTFAGYSIGRWIRGGRACRFPAPQVGHPGLKSPRLPHLDGL